MMRRGVFTVVLAMGLGQFALAQAPAGAPAGTTGQCNDGSYSSAASKAGACRGHQGVKAWFAAPPAGAMKASAASTAKPAPSAMAPAPAAKPAPAPMAAAPAAKPAPAPAPMAPAPMAAAPASKPAPSSMSMATAAPGGGAGMVWLNSSTNVYHCQGSRYYGKTKDGKYMTEAAAKSAGAHADHGKACGQ